MKVLVDLRTVSGTPSGIGHHAFHVVNQLSEALPAIELIGYTDDVTGELFERLSQRIRIIRFSGGAGLLNRLAYFRGIIRTIQNEEIDLFWQPNYINLRNIKRHCPKVRVMTSLHDASPLIHKKDCSLLYRLYFRFFVDSTIRQSDYLLYISETGREEIEKVFPKARSKSSRVIYPLIWNQAHVEAREEAGDYFLYYGNLELRKGSDLLLSAYDRYRRRGGTKGLKLFGNIRNEQIKMQLAQAMITHGGLVKHLDYLDEETKWVEIGQAYAGIFPSLAEGFGIPAVEMSLAGKPVIVSDLPIYNETLGNSACCFALDVQPQQTIENLADAMLEQDTLSEKRINLDGRRYYDLDAYKDVIMQGMDEEEL